ncbi:MAG TPA: alpha/beta hydrolase [Fusibacter sp.]|nr:alpha/beta hydrolase [Fusibacter sp.]
MNNQNMSMTNRFLEKEKLLKQFDKKTLTFEAPVEAIKTFEYAIKGDGSPTVVLINGAGGPIEGWMKIWPLLNPSITVMAYNRLGVDKSSEPTTPQHAVTMAEDLKKLLLTLDLQPPYLLVAHSLGGFVARVFASMYPQDTMGVLFLESSTIEDVTMKAKKIKGNPNSEVNCVSESVTQIRALTSFPQVPITVIAGFHPIARMWLPKGRFYKRFEHQKKLLELSVQSSLVVATKSGHFPQMNEPRLVVETIYKMIGL